VLIEELDGSRGYLGDQYRITKFSGTIYEFDFNKQFVCAMQIMEQILKLGENYLSMSMNFLNQKLTIAMNTRKGAFEPFGVTSKFDYEHQKRKVFLKIKVCYDRIHCITYPFIYVF